MQAYSNLLELAHYGRNEAGTREARPISPVHRVSRWLGGEAVARLVADYQAGVPSTELMRRYSIAKGSVPKLLDENGVTRRDQRLNRADRVTARELYQQGRSIA